MWKSWDVCTKTKRPALNCKPSVQGKRLWNLVIWPEYGRIELKVGCVERVSDDLSKAERVRCTEKDYRANRKG